MRGRLHVDDRLLYLPLLDLAEDVATRYDLMDVVIADLSIGGDLDGLTAWQGRDVVVIMLDVDNMRRREQSVEWVWAHELSHAIDLLDGRVGMRNGRRRDINRREDFANHLAMWLLEEPQPTTLREATPYVVEMRRLLRRGEGWLSKVNDFYVPTFGIDFDSMKIAATGDAANPATAFSAGRT